MRAIHKYPIHITETQSITVPRGWAPFKAGADPQGIICIWAEVETNNPKEEATIMVVGTGHAIPDLAANRRVDSFVDGPYVWHVYAQYER